MSLLVGLYVIGAVLTFGLSFGWVFAYWQTEFPNAAEKNKNSDYWSAFRFATFAAILFPVGPFIILDLTGCAKDGWRIK